MYIREIVCLEASLLKVHSFAPAFNPRHVTPNRGPYLDRKKILKNSEKINVSNNQKVCNFATPISAD